MKGGRRGGWVELWARAWGGMGAEGKGMREANGNGSRDVLPGDQESLPEQSGRPCLGSLSHYHRT